MGLLEEHRRDVMAYYCAAVAERERERMPLIGPSVDRRTLALLQRVYNSDAIKSLVCFVRGQIHTYMKDQQFLADPLRYRGTLRAASKR